MFCRKCGEEMPEDSTFQCECGAEVRNEDRYCHKCGSMFSSNSCGKCNAEMPVNANFCPGCGEKISKAESEEPVEENAPQEEPDEDIDLVDISKR